MGEGRGSLCRTSTTIVYFLFPGELSMDQTAILQLAENNGGQVNVSSLRDELGWELERSNRSLDKLLSDGLAWIDNQGEDEYPLYWIPSIFTSLS